MKVPNKGSKDARIVVGIQPSKEYAENYDRIFGKREECAHPTREYECIDCEVIFGVDFSTCQECKHQPCNESPGTACKWVRSEQPQLKYVAVVEPMPEEKKARVAELLDIIKRAFRGVR